jgi:hypothetical protein
MANVQRSLIERRSSPMDLINAPHQPSGNARQLQPERRRRLRLVR